MPAAVTSVAADSANLAPAIRNSCTPSLLRHPATSAPLLALNPVSTPALLPTSPIPPMQLGLLPTPSPATRLLVRPPPVASPVVRLNTNGHLPSLSTTLVPHAICHSPTRSSRPSLMSTVPPRLQSRSSNANTQLRSPLTAVSSKVPDKPASAPSTVDASPATASVTPPAHSGCIRPAHSVTEYNQRDFPSPPPRAQCSISM